MMQAKKTVKGGGLFGMFQQDTVYADESAGSAGGLASGPSVDEIERSVTKRGRGMRKPRRSAQRTAQQVCTSLFRTCDVSLHLEKASTLLQSKQHTECTVVGSGEIPMLPVQRLAAKARTCVHVQTHAVHACRQARVPAKPQRRRSSRPPRLPRLLARRPARLPSLLRRQPRRLHLTMALARRCVWLQPCFTQLTAMSQLSQLVKQGNIYFAVIILMQCAVHAVVLHACCHCKSSNASRCAGRAGSGAGS